ncbi:MAG: hypothetical protein AMS27_13875, partial [Bacteroides sp. SM23_62_1]
DITDQLVNLTNQVQVVTYHFKARIRDDRTGYNFGYCDQGGDTLLTVYVNPTPRLGVSMPDTIFCDSSTVMITVNDLLGSVEGVKVYELTTTNAGGNVVGVQAGGEYAAGTDFSNQLINLTNQVQVVTYHFKARIRDDRVGYNFGYCDQGGDTLLTIYVNPTPRLNVSIPDTIFCDSSIVTVTVNDLLNNVEGVKVYELTTTNAGGNVVGVQPTGEYAAGEDITDQLVNLTNQVQVVTYHFKARIRDDRVGYNFGYCDQGGDTLLTVYVNPTPRLGVSVPDTIFCDSSTVTINVNDLLNNVEGVKVYELTTTDAGGNVLGVQTSGEYAASTDFSDQLINITNQVQIVTYHFKARIRDDRVGYNFGYCDQGGDTLLIIYINPTPRFNINVADTLVCDSTTIILDVTDLMGNVEGAKVYDLTTTYNPARVTGITADNEFGIFTNIVDQVINLTNEVQTVTYHFRVKIKDDRTGYNFGYCDHGVDTSITIYINPTPRINISILDTIICDSSMITFTITDNNGFVYGEKVYELSTVYNAGEVTGVLPEGEYLRIDASNFLVNQSNVYQDITYRFKARIKDTRPGHTGNYCDQGPDTTIIIHLNPTPRIFKPSTLKGDKYCNDSVVTITITSPTVPYPGGNVFYDLVTTHDPAITGVQPDGPYQIVDGTASFVDVLHSNHPSSVLDVLYHFTPWIQDTRPGPDCRHNGVNDSIRIYVAATLIPTAIPDTFYGGWNISCWGFSNGSINLDVRGGIAYAGFYGDYTYLWSTTDGAGLIPGDQNQDGLIIGTYNVVVTDDIGCIGWDTITLYQPDEYRLDSTYIDVNPCIGGKKATVEIQVSGGTEPYDFTWRGPNDYLSKSQNIYDLFAGIYTLESHDMNNCILNDPNGGLYLIEDPDPISLSVDTSHFGAYHISCFGESDAWIDIAGGFGNGPYREWTYKWTYPDGNIADTLYIGLLSSGTYILELWDTADCYHREEIYIREPDIIRFDSVNTLLYGGIYNISCVDSVDGMIELYVSNIGRVGRNYSYEWEGPADAVFDTDPKANTQANIPDGTYNIHVTDQYGCYTDTVLTLYEPPAIIAVPTFSDYNNYNIACHDSSDGWISVDVSGGLGPWDYQWVPVTGGSISTPDQDSIYSLTAGDYEVTVTDSLNCVRQWTYSLQEPLVISTSEVLSDYNSYNISCTGNADGAVLGLNPSGGIGGYTYSWTRSGDPLWSDTTETPSGLPADLLTVEVRDLNNCLFVDTITLNEPVPLVVDSFTWLEITCNANDDGFARVFVSGGVDHLPYNYLWNNPANSTADTANNLSIGWYNVLVTDANGCTTFDSVYIAEPLPVNAQFNIISEAWYHGEMISCAGYADGAVRVMGSGGRKPYTYEWLLTGETNDTIFGLAADTYYVRITDAGGCDTILTVTLDEPNPLNAIGIVESDVTCYGWNDGKINLQPRGGVSPYTFRWTNEHFTDDVTTEDLENIFAGDYFLIMFDLNLCRLDTFFTVDEPDELTAEIIIDSIPFCPDSYDGMIHVSVSGGTEPYNIWWINQNLDDTVLYNLGQGVYAVQVDDQNNCGLVLDTVILISDALNCLTIPTAISPNGDGKNDFWEIRGIEYYPDAIIEIFDRWGDLIFRSDRGYEEKFDGTFRGRQLPVDSYHFIINLNNGRKPITGHITIIH